jgi:hypothetical protein
LLAMPIGLVKAILQIDAPISESVNTIKIFYVNHQITSLVNFCNLVHACYLE